MWFGVCGLSGVFANIPTPHTGWELHTVQQPNAFCLPQMQKQCTVAGKFIRPPPFSGRWSTCSSCAGIWVPKLQLGGKSEKAIVLFGDLLTSVICDHKRWLRAGPINFRKALCRMWLSLGDYTILSDFIIRICCQLEIWLYLYKIAKLNQIK